MSLANGCKNGFTAQFDILPPPIVRRFLQPLNTYVYLCIQTKHGIFFTIRGPKISLENVKY
jgi:hypothetical protein